MFGSPLAVSALLPLLVLASSFGAPPSEASDGVAAGEAAPVELPIDVDPATEDFQGPRILAAEAFESGRNAFDAGRYEEAIEHFERAQDFVPHPDTKYNLGVALVRAEQPLRAWHLFDELAREAKDSQVRDDARAQLREVEAKIALLRVMAAPDAVVCVDDEFIDDADALRRMPLAAGEHHVVVNHRPTTLELFAGELRVIHVEAEAPQPQTHRPAMLGLLGAGAAGSATALGLSIGAAGSSSDSRRQGLAAGAAAGAAVGLISSAAALALHMRHHKATSSKSASSLGPCELLNAD